MAPQTPTPLHTMGQKMCFEISGMGVFAMRYAKKYQGFLGSTPYTHTARSRSRQRRFYSQMLTHGRLSQKSLGDRISPSEYGGVTKQFLFFSIGNAHLSTSALEAK